MSRESDIQIGVVIGKFNDLELVDTALWCFGVPLCELDDPINTVLKKEFLSRGILSKEEVEVVAKTTRLREWAEIKRLYQP